LSTWWPYTTPPKVAGHGCGWGMLWRVAGGAGIPGAILAPCMPAPPARVSRPQVGLLPRAITDACLTLEPA